MLTNTKVFHHPIQVEFQYTKGDWVEYEVFGYDGRISSHYQISNKGRTKLKLLFDTKKNSAKRYLYSAMGNFVEIIQNYSFEKDQKKSDYEITFFEDDRKNINEYDCYKVIIIDKNASKKIVAYVTDAFKNIPFAHHLNLKFPKLKAFPLDIVSSKRTGKATRILQKIDHTELLKNDPDEEYQVMNKESLNDLVQDIFGISADQYIKGLNKIKSLFLKK